MDVKNFFGGLMVSAGIVSMVLTGGCSLFYISEILSIGSGYLLNIESVAFMGGIPFLISLVVFLLGRKLLKN